MNRDNIRRKVCTIIAETLSIDASEISEADDLVKDLCADSLDMAEIEMVLNEEFELDDDSALLESARTVGALITAVEKLLEAKEGK